MLVLYLKEGCPYCNLVLNQLKKKDIDTKIYWAQKDFTIKDFKKNYGEDATFPRGFVVKNNKNKLLDSSEKILKYISSLDN